jgi:hypothetical protein
MLKQQPIAHAISQTFPRKISETFGTSISEAIKFDQTLVEQRTAGRRPVPMTRILEAGVDLTQFEEDYHYSANFDMVFVTRGSRLDVWLYLSL